MRRALAAVLTVGVVAVAGCSSGGSHSSSGGAGADATNPPAKRWWSNSAVSAGSTIDPAHPDAEAGKLHPSDAEYCAMLSDTLKAGKSILPGVTAKDPALLAATTAFVAEIQKTAPSAVTSAWSTLAPVIIGLAKAGGVPSANTGEVTQAATTIATDAKTRCGLNLAGITAAPTQ
jgi:hypothetical protein